MNDLEFRKFYHKILKGLLAIDDFTLDYFSLNRNLREIVIDFLRIPDFNHTIKNKKQLLTALEEISSVRPFLCFVIKALLENDVFKVWLDSSLALITNSKTCIIVGA